MNKEAQQNQERLLPFYVDASLVGSGLMSLLSAIAHYSMGVNPWVPAIELAQCLVEVTLWFVARATHQYAIIFPLQMLGALTGMSCVLLVGGEPFLTNLFWIPWVAASLLIAGYKWMAAVAFFANLSLVGAFFHLYKPSEDSVGASFALDGLLYAIAMLLFIGVIKRTLNRYSESLAKEREAANETQEAKNQFLIHMNHELRNPLTAVSASVEILKAELTKTSSSEIAKKMAGTIDVSVKHVMALLNDVLQAERLEASPVAWKTSFAELSIRSLASKVLDIHKAQADASGCRLNFRLESDLHDAWVGDEKKIIQVVSNLVSNSLKYAQGTDVFVDFTKATGGINIEVRDMGPGLSKDAKLHLFKSFSAPVSSPGNTGLGLKICKLIVEKELGGKLQHIETTIGTKFFAFIPVEKS